MSIRLIVTNDTLQILINKIKSKFIRISALGTANGVATLDANGRIPSSQLPLTTLKYQGPWDASTGVFPDTTNLSQNDYYEVSAAGTINNVDYNVRDWIIWNGSSWNISYNANGVNSINGLTGNVSLTGSNLTMDDPAIDNRSITTVVTNKIDKYLYNTTGSGTPSSPKYEYTTQITQDNYGIEYTYNYKKTIYNQPANDENKTSKFKMTKDSITFEAASIDFTTTTNSNFKLNGSEVITKDTISGNVKALSFNTALSANGAIVTKSLEDSLKCISVPDVAYFTFTSINIATTTVSEFIKKKVSKNASAFGNGIYTPISGMCSFYETSRSAWTIRPVITFQYNATPPCYVTILNTTGSGVEKWAIGPNANTGSPFYLSLFC